MKLISRKAAIAAITAAAVTAGTMTAPAMADKKPANPPASTSQSAAPSSSKAQGSSNAVVGSSELFSGSSETSGLSSSREIDKEIKDLDPNDKDYQSKKEALEKFEPHPLNFIGVDAHWLLSLMDAAGFCCLCVTTPGHHHSTHLTSPTPQR